MNDALILCAGRGERLRPLTDSTPKVMLPVGGVPLLEHHIRHFADQGITNFFINLSYRGDDIRSFFEDGSRFGIRIRYADEPEPQGTAGALRGFPGELASTFLVHYGDIYTRLDIRRMLEFHRERDASATLAAHPTTRFHDADVLEVEADDRIVAFRPRPGTSRYGDLGNAACYILEPTAVSYVSPSSPDDFVRDVFPKMLAGGERMFAYRTTELLHDIGTPERYREIVDRT